MIADVFPVHVDNGLSIIEREVFVFHFLQLGVFCGQLAPGIPQLKSDCVRLE
jgi:hypothetical protein